MKTISRELGQRMWGGMTATTIGGGSGEGGGGVSAAWVDGNYLSKEFFNQLFVVHINTKVTVTDGLETTETNTAGVLSPNDTIPEDVVEQDTPSEGYTTTTHVSITSIEATTNFWSSLAISALGQGSGGGGGGATALSQLVDVQLSNLQNGQALVYDSTLNKWVNANVQGGSTAWADITGKPTTISGYGITDAYISGGTIYLGSNSITPLTSFTETDPTVPSWAKQPTKPSYSFSELTSHPTTLSGYGITDAVNSSTTWWGRSVSNNVVVGHIDMNNGDAVRFKANGGDGANWNCLTMNTSNTLSLGYYIRTHNQSLQLEGGTIKFYVNQNSGSATTPNDNPLEAAFFSTNGLLTLNRGLYTTGVYTDANNYTGIRIGGAMLSWDSVNNALKVHAAGSANGSIDFYSTGGVSALGQSSGGGGASSTLSQSYSMPYTGTSGTTYYWHKLGTYQMDAEAMCLVIDLFTGNGYNGTANQNSWARIIIKKSNTTSGTSGAVGITCEQFGRQISDGKILVRINATAYNTGEVWVKCPWGYPKGAYSVQGNFTAWTHNNSTSGDSTTGPTHNQNGVGYYNNTSTMTTGE